MAIKNTLFDSEAIVIISKNGDETHYKMHHQKSFLQESHSAMTGKNDK